MTDKTTGLGFLVDTGAEVSVIPSSAVFRKRRQTTSSLQAANKTPIATYGEQSLSLNIGLRRTFRWIFLIADVAYPILGADFLRHYNSLVDMHRKRLIDATTHLSVLGMASKEPLLAVASTSSKSVYDKLLEEFPSLLRPANFLLPVRRRHSSHCHDGPTHSRSSSTLTA